MFHTIHRHHIQQPKVDDVYAVSTLEDEWFPHKPVVLVPVEQMSVQDCDDEAGYVVSVPNLDEV